MFFSPRLMVFHDCRSQLRLYHFDFFEQVFPRQAYRLAEFSCDLRVNGHTMSLAKPFGLFSDVHDFTPALSAFFAHPPHVLSSLYLPAFLDVGAHRLFCHIECLKTQAFFRMNASSCISLPQHSNPPSCDSENTFSPQRLFLSVFFFFSPVVVHYRLVLPSHTAQWCTVPSPSDNDPPPDFFSSLSLI